MNIIGHEILDGVPYINGRKAVWDEAEPITDNDGQPFFSQWRCPDCNAHLSVRRLICLNACHLSVAAYKRMNTALNDSYWRTKSVTSDFNEPVT